ncbi:cache domain-containing protein, partial [Xanthovirga aplysinae]|uniref:cache domain-containing protein n=1 Tax=Xanthovirga aplysinae TaxID=2529853 RepID=UPI0012BB69C4
MKFRLHTYSKQFFILFFTILFVSGGVALYYYLDVKEKHKQLDQKAFNIIDRIIVNAYSKFSTYQTSTKYSVKKIIRESFREEYSIKKQASEISYKDIFNYLIATKAKKIPSISIPTQPDEHKELNLNSIKVHFNSEQNGRENLKSQYTYKLGHQSAQGKSFLDFTESFLHRNKQNEKLEVVYTYEVNFDDFIEPLLRRDFLTDYVIFLRNDQGKPFQKVYESFPYELDLAPLIPNVKDSLLLPPTSLSKIIMISGKKYKLFTQVVSGIEGGNWMVYGLMPYKEYNRLALRLDPYLILLLIFLILLLTFILPVINLIFRNTFKRIFNSDLFLAYFSLILVSALLSLLLLSTAFFGFIIPENRKIILKSLSEQINKQAAQNFKSSLIELIRADIKLYKNKNLDHYITSKNNSFGQLEFNPIIHEFFWVKKSGDMALEWINEKDEHPIFNISKRNYFKEVMKGKGWLYPLENPDVRFYSRVLAKAKGHTYTPGIPHFRYYYQPIYSYDEGVNLNILSIESLNHAKYKVAATSSHLNALRNTYLPPGYGFCIIDNKGEVLIHSNRNLNLRE